MNLDIVPKVFILRYVYSEEDEGILFVFNDFKPANDLKKRLEEAALKSNSFFKFYIDVYEVLNDYSQYQVDFFELLHLKI